jgi:ABC-type glycerol-3-phosphate transport system permease component
MNFLIALTVNLAGMSVIYSLMAFALARLRWRRRGAIAVLLTLVVAGQFWIGPAVLVRDTNHAAFASYAFAFCNWLISGFSLIVLGQAVRLIPRQLEDCARLDGCTGVRTYWHVLLPLVRRELCLIVFLTLIGTLMLVLVPPVRAYDPRFNATWLEWSLSLLPLEWLGPVSGPGLMMAISLVATLPMIVVFVFSKGPLLKAQEQAG